MQILLLPERFVPGSDLRGLRSEERLGGIDDLDAGDLITLLDGVHDILILRAVDGAEDGMLAVKPRGRDMGDEELTAVGAGSGIGH